VLASLRRVSQDDELVEVEFTEIRVMSLFAKRIFAERFQYLQVQSALDTAKLSVS
jgi:hypothetical protein